MPKATRREFMQWAAVGGISLSVSHIGLGSMFGLSPEAPPGSAFRKPATGRIDGVAKATGAKLYASDFRAADLPGWPQGTSHALLVRTSNASHIYSGIDFVRLNKIAKPSAIVTGEDVRRINARAPQFYAGDLFCPLGKTPVYLGQPLALLIFEKFDEFDKARLAMRDGAYVKYGTETGPVKAPNYGAFRFTRIAGPTPDAPDVYSPLQAGWVSPSVMEENTGRPIWKPLSIAKGSEYKVGATYGEEVRAMLAAKDAGMLVVERDFETQSIDPMFLEPECGLAWYDSASSKLTTVLGVQSPYEAVEALAFLLGEATPGFKPKSINAQFTYVGGGFGGRDHTPFPLYVALAAMFFPGHTVRLAHDRYQQFQGGIKRHAFQMHSRIGVDRTSGKIIGFAADHVLDGGGMMNYSASVAVVGATGALGIYDCPKVDVTTLALHTRGVTAGSMRGYGTLQSMTALETLIDELCTTLSIDPIEFRRRNALRPGERMMTGNPYSVSVRTQEILDKLEAHSTWKYRAEERARAKPGFLVGTGVACAAKDYGTGADCSLGRVEISPEGRVTVHCDAVEMGNGIGTAVANRVALHLGAIADDVTAAQVDAFDALEIYKTGDPYTMTQAAQDEGAKNPRWVPEISSATSSSIGAHVGTKASAEAARIIFRFGLWPAALALWGIAPKDPRANQWVESYWQGDTLIMTGLSPLPLAKIAAKVHSLKLVTGAMAHAFSRWAWSQATFPLGDTSWSADIDALAVRYGTGDFVRLDRTLVTFAPTDYNRIGTAFSSLCGTTVRVEIERATGVLRIAKAYSVFECGQVLVPEVVRGQAHGGFAMGVGYALLETLPPFETGPGNGQWNLGKYLIARSSDLPMHDLEVEILPPIAINEPPKGVAEVVMIPVVPALLNAIFDATGHRFQSLPVTQEKIKGLFV
jgi:CO/xanthine dehydrogenase Mo-binding subunit